MGKKKTKGASAASPVHVETIAAGDGVSFPQDGDEIVCHYVGRLAADGTVFDSSRAKGKPFTFKLGQGQVIRGWELGFSSLTLGQRATLSIASSAAYGAAGAQDRTNASGTGVIPPHADLAFDVELLDINGRRQVMTRWKLEAFKGQMLAKYDGDDALRAKMDELYGGREGYSAHLDKMAEAKLSKEQQDKAEAKVEAASSMATAARDLEAASLSAEQTAKGSSGAGTEAKEGRSLSFDARFALIKVEPNDDDEARNKNFPRSLHNAAELFAALGHGESAARLHECTSKLLSTLAAGPDGKTTHAMGRACVCWSCGYVGLPSNAAKCSETKPTPAGVCANCGSAEQTNFCKVTKPDGGGVVPWIEERATGLDAAHLERPGAVPAAALEGAPEGKAAAVDLS